VKETCELIEFGLGGHGEEYGPRREGGKLRYGPSHLSGYSQPENWTASEKREYPDGCPVLDKRAVLAARPGLAYASPLPEAGQTAPVVKLGDTGIMGEAMKSDSGNLFGSLIRAHEACGVIQRDLFGNIESTAPASAGATVSFKVSRVPCVREPASDSPTVRTPEELVLVAGGLRDLAQEAFAVATLDAKNGLLDFAVVTLGLADATLVHPREVFRRAILDSACAVIVVHNHPSGDPSPSAADIRITKELVAAGKIIEIRVLDHVIQGACSSAITSGRGAIRVYRRPMGLGRIRQEAVRGYGRLAPVPGLPVQRPPATLATFVRLQVQAFLAGSARVLRRRTDRRRAQGFLTGAGASPRYRTFRDAQEACRDGSYDG